MLQLGLTISIELELLFKHLVTLGPRLEKSEKVVNKFLSIEIRMLQILGSAVYRLRARIEVFARV